MRLPNKKRAIQVKCADCMGWYQDGRVDCERTTCPLYHWMPNRKREPNLWWIGVYIKDLYRAFKKAYLDMDKDS